MTTYQFHFPATGDATLTIVLPEELRGEPLNVVVAKEPAKSPVQDLLDFCTDEGAQKGILGLRGILKDCTMEELENARFEYLAEKYIHEERDM